MRRRVGELVLERKSGETPTAVFAHPRKQPTPPLQLKSSSPAGGTRDVDQMVARLNDPATVKMVATAIGAPEAEARSMLADIQQKVEAARTDPAQAAAAARQGLEQITARASERVERAAAAAQPYASRTAWITLGAMLLSLLAAVGGAMTGRRQAAKRLTNV